MLFRAGDAVAYIVPLARPTRYNDIQLRTVTRVIALSIIGERTCVRVRKMNNTIVTISQLFTIGLGRETRGQDMNDIKVLYTYRAGQIGVFYLYQRRSPEIMIRAAFRKSRKRIYGPRIDLSRCFYGRYRARARRNTAIACFTT